MRLNYQVLNFNYEKVISVIQKANQFKMAPNSITIGDFSCFRSNAHFFKKGLNELLHETKQHGIDVLYQLPLITKQEELENIERFIETNEFDGFLTGDLGVLEFLSKLKNKHLIYVTNVLNATFSDYLKHFHITSVRPLMFKRVFIEESIGLSKDIVVYGNMMLNCSIFCFHSKDLVANCKFKCNPPKRMIMNKEVLHLVGRSLITEKRFSLLNRMKHIKDLDTATIMDFSLTEDEILKVFKRILNEKNQSD
jgi:collagenase-like PrtC family protease